MLSSEWSAKVAAVRGRLQQTSAVAALLASRAGFAWITGGGANHVNHASELGVGLLFVPRESGPVTLLCANIESARFRDEELPDGGRLSPPVEFRDWPWHDPDGRARTIRELAEDGTVLTDLGIPGCSAVPDAGLAGLRRVLLPIEQDRYRQAGRLAGVAVAEAARAARPGQTEGTIAGVLHERLLSAGLWPWVTLVAGDERIARYRHPVVQAHHQVRQAAMLVACASYRGLVVALTRLVSFGRPAAELVARHAALAAVDAALIAGSRPGRTFADILADGIAAYRTVGWPDEWRHHHQGGPTGYVPREFIATPDSQEILADGQAVAWNPSIAGTKSEDTILATAAGPEILSASPDWPSVTIDVGGRKLSRPDWLVL